MLASPLGLLAPLLGSEPRPYHPRLWSRWGGATTKGRDVRITDLPRRRLNPDLRDAIAAVVGHDNFVFLVVAEEPDGTKMLSDSNEALAALRALART